MAEHFSEAIVLSAKDLGELDRRIFLYSKELGKINAKAKSLRKITSKLAGHLEPLSFIQARFSQKNGFQIIEANLLQKAEKNSALINFFEFAEEALPEEHPDEKVWDILLYSLLNSTPDYKNFISVLGYDDEFASCHNCHTEKPEFFSKKEHIFICKTCTFSLIFNFPEAENDLIKMN